MPNSNGFSKNTAYSLLASLVSLDVVVEVIIGAPVCTENQLMVVSS